MKCKKLFVLGSTALLSLASVAAFVPAAHADVVVTAGTLDFDPAGAPTIGNFAGVTLNGNPQLTSLQVSPFTIIDATGSQAGWHVTLTVPSLVNSGPTTPVTIAATQITTAPWTIAGAAGSDTTGVTGNDYSALGTDFSAGQTVVDSAVGDGSGTYLVSPTILKLTVPVNASVGTYASTATIAVTSGP
ncbi:MAG TPA: hypothetical protein VGO03_10500 [Acidimicrobiia bacterium]|jgi:hypothetical protein